MTTDNNKGKGILEIFHCQSMNKKNVIIWIFYVYNSVDHTEPHVERVEAMRERRESQTTVYFNILYHNNSIRMLLSFSHSIHDII
jgi:hypothetical protein